MQSAFNFLDSFTSFILGSINKLTLAPFFFNFCMILLKKETIFCERVNGKFTLRRGFNIKKGARVLIIEDVITTGKSSLECVKLIKKSKAKLIGFASIIDRSTKQSLKIKTGIASHLKIDVPTFKANKLPPELKSIPVTTPGSRFIK